MTTFDEREQTYERKFAHDEELRFKATVRRNKLLGLWAAGKLGLEDEAAQTYAKEVVKADFEEVGDEDVVRKLMADFKAKDLDISEHLIRRRLSECMDEARQQILAEAGN